MPNQSFPDLRSNAGRLKRLLAIGGTITLLVILVGFALGIHVIWINTRPLPKPPTVRMPKPNAYDYYVAAGKMVKDEKKIGYASHRGRLPAPDPKYPYIRAYTLAEKRNLLKKNASALAKMREAFAYECRHPADKTFFQLHPENSTLHNLANLLVLESQVKQAEGDIAGAVSSCLDAYRVGYDIQRGSVAAYLTGRSMQSISRYRLVGLIPRLGAVQGRVAALRLEELRALQEPYSETLTEEKWEVLAGFEDFRTKQSWPWLYEFMADRAKRRYSAFMDKWIAAVRQPYASNPPRPMDPPNGVFDVFFENHGTLGWFADVQRRATTAMLNVELALQAYQEEHGKYPTSLPELKPRYLKNIPDDPFAVKGPLGYKLDGKKYVLYSVGPDGKDDGGSPVDEVTRKMKGFKASEHSPGWTPKVIASSARRFDVDEDSKGDIVAGVNTD